MNYSAPRYGYASYRPSSRSFPRSNDIYSPYSARQQQAINRRKPNNSSHRPRKTVPPQDIGNMSALARFFYVLEHTLRVNDLAKAVLDWFEEAGAEALKLCCTLFAAAVVNAVTVGIVVGVSSGAYHSCCSCRNGTSLSGTLANSSNTDIGAGSVTLNTTTISPNTTATNTTNVTSSSAVTPTSAEG